MSEEDLLDIIKATYVIDGNPTLGVAIKIIESLRTELAEWKSASQEGHQYPCTLGPLCPYCEIERKDKRIEELEGHIQIMVQKAADNNLEGYREMGRQLAAKDKRIEELEIALFRWERGGKDDGIFFITSEQIDMLWKRRSFYTGAVLVVIDDCLDAIKIVACPECGGSGQGGGDPNALTESCWPCKYCHGHGWVRK